MPKISVILPVYNGEKYIFESVRSILDQSFVDFELLIIDDGSIDSTLKILNNIKDTRISIFNFSSNQGITKALNFGLKQASGKFVARMDADDVAHPQRLEITLLFFEKHPDYSLFGTRRSYSCEWKELKDLGTILFLEHRFVKSIALINNPLIHSSVMFKKEFLVSHSLLYDKKFIHSEDNALWIDFIQYGANVGIIEAPLIFCRFHDDQVSKKYAEIQKINSCKKRIEWIKINYSNITNENLINSYKILSFKEKSNSFLHFEELYYLYKELLKFSIEDEQIDEFEFNKILIRRIKTIFWHNFHFGYRLINMYFKNFLNVLGLGFGLKLIYFTFIQKKWK